MIETMYINFAPIKPKQNNGSRFAEIKSVTDVMELISTGLTPLISWAGTKSLMIEMAEKQTKYSRPVCNGIINAIEKYYMIMPDFYPHNALLAFKTFLETGKLELKEEK